MLMVLALVMRAFGKIQNGKKKLKMRQTTFISLLFSLALLIASCNTPKAGDSEEGQNSRMEFTVTKIQNEKDGQSIFMQDDKGGQYTTIISIPNGNWIDLTVGDRISLVATEILESHPAQIISKDIKVIEHQTNMGYEKIEEETYWIHARKKEALGIWEQPVSCFQYQTGTTINKNAEWKLLCEEIEYFDYKEGYYYQIKVLKKWLENHENLMDRVPYDLELVTVVSKEKDETYVHPVKTTIRTNKKSYKLGEAIQLTLEVNNTAASPYTFLPWGTPIENRFTGDCLTVTLNGKELPYTGIMVKRMAPTDKDYITLQQRENTSGQVNLLDGYKLTEKGLYKVQFKEQYNGIPASNVVELRVE